MSIQITAKGREGADIHLDVDKWPDTCPRCHHAIHPVRVGVQFAIKEDGWGGYRLEIVFRCPKYNCERFFIGRYSRMSAHSGTLGLRDCVPYTQEAADFSEAIKSISENYVQVCTEAVAAEQMGLRLAAGPAYRKALEFLIKDYVIALHPTQADLIKAMPLGECIKKLVKNDQISAVAKRAAWLGNDETHYTRKWDGKDLEDLKALIDLTEHWIEMEELTKRVVGEMPEG